MRFAKLFDFPTGQLLVQRADSDDPEDDCPYQLIVTTKHPSGVGVEVRPGYADEAKRDAFFEALGEAKALEFFTSQQKLLSEAAA
jgi:hypothetical protein